jgi:hypothetical protein
MEITWIKGHFRLKSMYQGLMKPSIPTSQEL